MAVTVRCPQTFVRIVYFLLSLQDCYSTRSWLFNCIFYRCRKLISQELSEDTRRRSEPDEHEDDVQNESFDPGSPVCPGGKISRSFYDPFHLPNVNDNGDELELFFCLNLCLEIQKPR